MELTANYHLVSNDNHTFTVKSVNFSLLFTFTFIMAGYGSLVESVAPSNPSGLEFDHFERPRFDSHKGHSVVFLSKTLHLHCLVVLVRPRKTSRHD